LIEQDQSKILKTYFYCVGDKIEKNEMGGSCISIVEWRGVYRVLVGKSEGNRPMGRSRHRWADDIKMDLQEVECAVLD
jgi:hypothetical protein